MNASTWFAALVDGLIGFRSVPRRSLWSRTTRMAAGAQLMESRFLLTGSLADAPLYGPWTDALPEPARYQSPLGSGDAQSAVYGPVQPAGLAGSLLPPSGPSGADGTLAGNVDGMIAGTEDGTGWGSIDGVIEGNYDGTVYGNIDGTFVGTEDGTIDGAVFGMIDGDGNLNGAFDGVVDGTPSGTDDGSLDGTADGDADGSTQGQDSTINITTTDPEAWEGPYTVSRNDEAMFRLQRSGGGMLDLNVAIEFSGKANASIDYMVTDDLRRELPLENDVNTGKPRVYVHMPANTTAVEFFIVATMDGDYELPENVIATIVVNAAYIVGQSDSAEATIVDYTADLDITSLNPGSGFLDEDKEDDPGAIIRLDKDHDAGEAAEDRHFYVSDEGRPFPLAENDVVELRITSHLQAPNDAEPIVFKLDHNPLQVRIWLLGIVGGDMVKWIPYAPEQVLTIPLNGLMNLKVEGIAAGRGSITLVGHSSLPNGPTSVFDSVQYAVWDLDLDIDSDNNDGFNYPQNTVWEEHLEDHTHALGKLLKLNATHFTPSRLRLPTGLNPQDPDIRIRLEFTPAGESGTIKVWNTYKADPNRNLSSISVQQGGSRIYSGTYSLEQLGYNQQTGALTLWLEAIAVTARHWDKRGVVENGKPDDRINAVLLRSGIELTTDEVKYMVIADNSFYDNLQNRRELRNAMASEGVYAAADLPEFALKKLSPQELDELGCDDDMILEFDGTSSIPGFMVELYRDYVSGQFVLAFAGTDDVSDVLVDIWNGVGQYTRQYLKAMEIADAIRNIPQTGSELAMGVVTTGHSLGGGLASAASVVGGFSADTFNAAGLTESAVCDEAGDELYVGALQNYVTAAQRIDAYYLDWDILSLIQDWTPLQDAIGNRIQMEGPVDSRIAVGTIPVLAGTVALIYSGGVAWPVVWALLLSYGAADPMMDAHTTLYYQYGLMVQENLLGEIVWDIYGYVEP